jgi:hypothetical protein
MIYYCTGSYLTIFFLMATEMSRKDPDLAESVINWPPGYVSGPVIYDYISVDPDPKEILTDPERWQK